MEGKYMFWGTEKTPRILETTFVQKLSFKAG